MATTITLPENLEAQLQQQAAAQHRSVEAVALDILREALDTTMPVPTVEDVVAKIKATSPNLHNVRPASGSPASVLRCMPDNMDFDLAQWNADWAAVEAEMRAMTGSDDLAEGRG